MNTWRLSRSLRAMMAGIGLLVPLTLAVLVRVALTPPRQDPDEASSTEAPPTCDSTRFTDDDNTCAPGARCIANECRTLQVDERARSLCGEYTCSDDEECFHGTCTASSELPIAPAACQDSEALLRELQRICAIDQSPAETKITSCRYDHLEMLTDDGSYEELILELPDTFTVHFPAGQPSGSGHRLDRAKKSLMDDLRGRLGPLQNAKAVLVFGRASAHTGDDRGNRELAARRAATVAGLLHNTLADLDPTGGAASPVIIDWSRAAKSALALGVLQKAIHTTPLTWPGADREGLTAFFVGDLHHDAIPSDQLDDFRDLANQVVFIAPLPCDGTEYFPRPSLPAMGPQLGKAQ